MKRLMLLLALVLATACVRNPRSRIQQPETILRVDNRAFLDMTIYVVRGGETVRLGIATGTSTTLLPIPARLIFGPTPLRFQADPIGAPRQPISEEINVTAGDEVTIIIPPQ